MESSWFFCDAISRPASSKYLCDGLTNVFSGARSTDCYAQRNSPPPSLVVLLREENPSTEYLVRHGFVAWFFDSLDQNELLLEMNLLKFANLRKPEALGAPPSNSSWTTDLLEYAGRCGIVHGGMLKLAELYKSSRDKMQQLALGFYGINAGDLLQSCDFALEEFFLAIENLIYRDDLCMLRIVSKTLYKFCAFLDYDFREKGRLYRVLRRLIFSDDLDVLTDACWALANFPCNTVEDIEEVISSDVCSRLAKLLTCHSSYIVSPVLLTLGKVAAGTYEHSRYLISQGVLPKLKDLLVKDNNDRITILACFSISCITSHSSENVQEVINSGLVPPLINLLKGEIDCKKDALQAILACADVASPQQFECLFDVGCLEPLCSLLSSENEVVVECCLKLLDDILNRRDADQSVVDEYKNVIAKVGGLNNMRKLKAHRGRVFFMAIDLLSRHWPDYDFEFALVQEFGRVL